jgi:hypothetical protein
MKGLEEIYGGIISGKGSANAAASIYLTDKKRSIDQDLGSEQLRGKRRHE